MQNVDNAYKPSHTGLCVTDLDRSLRFYCDGLGFEKANTYHLTRQIAEVVASQIRQAAQAQVPLGFDGVDRHHDAAVHDRVHDRHGVHAAAVVHGRQHAMPGGLDPRPALLWLQDRQCSTFRSGPRYTACLGQK